jgi:hypothetical protein
MAGSSKHDSEPSGFVKGRKFLDQFSDYQLLKKDSTSWSYFKQIFVG